MRFNPSASSKDRFGPHPIYPKTSLYNLSRKDAIQNSPNADYYDVFDKNHG
jgi:hypothetical protein